MRKKLRLRQLLFFAAIFFAAFAYGQNATVYGPSCIGPPLSTWLTIQQAVNAAAPGECIIVDPGTYPENRPLS